jgi:Mce-associated membrane protein
MARHADAASRVSEHDALEADLEPVEYPVDVAEVSGEDLDEHSVEESVEDPEQVADEVEVEPAAPPSKRSSSPIRLAAIVGGLSFVLLAALIGWLGYGAYQEHSADNQRQLFVQTARQGVLNLTTIDWQRADSDVQRIIDSATGTFQSDFSLRSKPFVEVVKQVKSTSVGTITEAGLESSSSDDAVVLVTASIKTTMPNQPDADAKSWRMRISLQKVGENEIKISNVAFVP